MIAYLPFFALFSPFVSAVFVLLTHKRISFFIATISTIGALAISFIATLITWRYISSLSGVFFFDFAEMFKKYWLCSNWTQITLSFLFDELCLFMLILVVGVSLCVHVYSVEYMHQDPERNLFFAYLSLFTFFMLILVSAGNFIQFFIGWEGIGMCSYLLINFWYMRIEANKAAIKAVVVNKIGDCAYLIGIGLVYYNFKTLNIVSILDVLSTYQLVNFYNISLPFIGTMSSWTVLSLFFLIAVMGKSAQIGLHTWLPDAMEGPTPVSALIHAATMVTAGIFLVIRLSNIFEMSTTTLHLMVIIGSLTAFFAASVALVQNDIKKIIAYSTCSQLGYMLTACGLSKYGIAFFHLFTHGFFKALLFLCAGAILHGMSDDQDLRRMGGLGSKSPFLYIMLLVGSIALTGFPFLSGFYSKELIIFSSVYDMTVPGGLLFYVLLVIAAVFTTLYSFKLFYLAFLNKKAASANVMFHSSGLFVNIALFLLSFGALFVGYIFQDFFLLFTNEMNVVAYFYDDLMPLSLRIFLVSLIFLNILLISSYRVNVYLFEKIYVSIYERFFGIRQMFWFLSKKWYFDKIYNNYVTRFVFKWAYKIFYLLDVYLFEMFGPRGVTFLLLRGAKMFSALQTGSIFFYLTIILVVGFSIFFFMGV